MTLLDPIPSTSLSLLQQLRESNDSGSWSEFESIYGAAIFRIARRRGLQTENARDATQQVLMAAMKKIRHWDPEQSGSFRAWLLTVTRNLLCNEIRRRRPETSIENNADALEHIPGATFESEIDWEYRRAQFRRLVDDLKREFHETTWQCFWMTSVDSKPAKQVADELGVSIASVYTNKCRVLKRLQRAVDANKNVDLEPENHHDV